MSRSLSQLLENLRNPDENVRQDATTQLWRMWFLQKGMWGLEQLQRAQDYMEANDSDRAEELLNEIIRDNPDFAEAWNRRAVLYYLQERFSESRDDCLRVVRLNQFHFGAWHGLGLCYAALGDYREAIRAFGKALDIQPYATANQRLILECTARLS